MSESPPEHVEPTPSRGLRIVRGVGWGLITLGVLMLGFVAHQLWVTDFFAKRAQSGLEDQLAIRATDLAPEIVVYDPDTGQQSAPIPWTTGTDGEIVPDPGSVEGFVPGGVDPLDRILRREPVPDAGDPLGTIRIPDIGLRWTVVEGVSRSDLKNGAGHMPDTPLPGQPGNSVVSGHRTTYGAPFNEIDELQPGDFIFWDSPVIGTHAYVVRESIVVDPTALWVTDPRDGGWLTLTTCNPEFSARERLIVFAELVEGPNAPVILDT